MPRIIQFNHPGFEHKHDKGDKHHKSWNDGRHLRKFMLSRGDYIDNDGSLVSNQDMMFWGEWEPDSYVRNLQIRKNDKYPEYIHTPYIPAELPTPNPGDGPCGPKDKHWQNTDPFVFGDNFKYAICRQGLQNEGFRIVNLKPGTLILFGSTYKQNEIYETLMIDTVFVVSKDSLSRQDLFSLNFDKISENDKTYFDVSFRMAYPKNTDYPLTHRIYRGVTYEERDQYGGMFSFSPAMICPEDIPRIGFSRKEINLIHPTGNPQFKFMSVEVIQEKCVSTWTKIKDSCLGSTGCIAIRFDMPNVEL
ncbi:hypothetical protein AGMMS50268_07390 [Spirochaetia bacterium]|nr:hypothetical protein AGMMS50268_07390 [Spirochaetia bacterium]